MSASPARTIRLVLLCDSPPAASYEGRPAEFGLQDARAVLHPGDVQPDGAVRFELEAAVKPHRDSGAPNFSGPFVHGPALGRFLYLGWRRIGDVAWIRRYKIPLAGITWELLDSGAPLRARVSAAWRGATLMPAEGGWTPQR